MSQARRFTELGVTGDAPLAEIEQVSQLVRSSGAPAAVEAPAAPERDAAPGAGNAHKA